MKSDDASEIDIPSRGGLRGRIDKLAHEYMLKASALKIAVEILDEDDRRTALDLAPKKFLQAINHRNGSTPTHSERRPRAERISEVTAYLAEHPGATSTAIGEALGWQLNQVLKYAAMVATRIKGARGTPSQWTLKAKASKMKAPKMKRRTIRQPRQERLDQIQGFLQRHPEAPTPQIAKAVGLKPNSSFVRLLRQVARPARETKATQPIAWVLSQ